jgi:hypothetical protein
VPEYEREREYESTRERERERERTRESTRVREYESTLLVLLRSSRRLLARVRRPPYRAALLTVPPSLPCTRATGHGVDRPQEAAYPYPHPDPNPDPNPYRAQAMESIDLKKRPDKQQFEELFAKLDPDHDGKVLS